MMYYRHSAYNVTTGEIINCEKGNQLKRAVAFTKQLDKEICGMSGQWRFSHDFGKKWEMTGFPKR